MAQKKMFAVKAFNLSPFGRDAKRLIQHAFSPCEHYALGLQAAGVDVRVAHCNEAGDIRERQWSEDLDAAPFRDAMHFPDCWAGMTESKALRGEG